MSNRIPKKDNRWRRSTDPENEPTREQQLRRARNIRRRNRRNFAKATRRQS